MRAPASVQDGERRLGICLDFAFGCVFVAVVLALAFIDNSLDDRRFEILRIVLALAGGGVGGVIPGFTPRAFQQLYQSCARLQRSARTTTWPVRGVAEGTGVADRTCKET